MSKPKRDNSKYLPSTHLSMGTFYNKALLGLRGDVVFMSVVLLSSTYKLLSVDSTMRLLDCVLLLCIYEDKDNKRLGYSVGDLSSVYEDLASEKSIRNRLVVLNNKGYLSSMGNTSRVRYLLSGTGRGLVSDYTKDISKRLKQYYEDE